MTWWLLISFAQVFRVDPRRRNFLQKVQVKVEGPHQLDGHAPVFPGESWTTCQRWTSARTPPPRDQSTWTPAWTRLEEQENPDTEDMQTPPREDDG